MACFLFSISLRKLKSKNKQKNRERRVLLRDLLFAIYNPREKIKLSRDKEGKDQFGKCGRFVITHDQKPKVMEKIG